MSETLTVYGKNIDASQLEAEILDQLGVVVSITVEPADRRSIEPPPFKVDTLILRRIVVDHEDSNRRQLRAIEEKAQAVRRGDDTFTAAQMQQLLAALVLREIDK